MPGASTWRCVAVVEVLITIVVHVMVGMAIERTGVLVTHLVVHHPPLIRGREFQHGTVATRTATSQREQCSRDFLGPRLGCPSTSNSKMPTVFCEVIGLVAVKRAAMIPWLWGFILGGCWEVTHEKAGCVR